ncbi:MAG TPA: hypothetical protein P5317_11880, partial [Myxococcota bacterium]|nr:hypothetical protein [Myxococcota bacterium]
IISRMLTVRSSMRVLLLAVLLLAVSSCQNDGSEGTDALDLQSRCRSDPPCLSVPAALDVQCGDEDHECSGMFDPDCGGFVYKAFRCPEGHKCYEYRCIPPCDDGCTDDPEFYVGTCYSGLHIGYCPSMKEECYANIIEHDCPSDQKCVRGRCLPPCDDSCLEAPDFAVNYCSGTHDFYCPSSMVLYCYATIDRECPDGKVCSQDTQMCEYSGQ